jgi:hypothetical protein
MPVKASHQKLSDYPNNPPPDPSDPPNVTYSSTCGGDLSSWDGSFTYNDGAIVYTRTNPSGTYNASNSSNGNAIVFSITDTNVTPSQTVQFNGSSFVWTGPNGNRAQYSGNCHLKGHGDNEDAWTATQTS